MAPIKALQSGWAHPIFNNTTSGHVPSIGASNAAEHPVTASEGVAPAANEDKSSFSGVSGAFFDRLQRPAFVFLALAMIVVTFSDLHSK
jgi:hypothetical protein